MTELVIWSALLFLVSGILWAIPATRRRPGIFMTGYKTLPVGCAIMVLTPVMITMAVGHLGATLCRHFGFFSPILDFSFVLAVIFVLIPLGIVCGVLTAIGLYRLLRRRYRAEADGMGFAAAGMAVFLLTLIVLAVFHHFPLVVIHPSDRYIERRTEANTP